MAADVPKTKDSRFFYFYRTIRLKRPHDSASTTARFSLNDRTIQPQRPHDSASTTARFGPDDRTMPEDGEKRWSGLAEHLPKGPS